MTIDSTAKSGTTVTVQGTATKPVTVALRVNGSEVATQTVTPNGQGVWVATFTNVPPGIDTVEASNSDGKDGTVPVPFRRGRSARGEGADPDAEEVGSPE
jgi:hypothetical protein